MSPAKTSLFFALVLLGASSVASAQSANNLDFEIPAGEGGSFPILANKTNDDGDKIAVDYALADGVVDFLVDTGIAYDNPLFCFDFSDQGSAVTLRAIDPNGHDVMDIGLDSSLNYDLATGSIGLSPSQAVQCFFQDVDAQNPEFGPFGTVADNQGSSSGGTGVFTDSFAVFPELDIEYQSLQINPGINSGDPLEFGDVAVSPGDVIEYQLVIENTGNAAADELAFQEVYPEYQIVNDLSESYFTAALSEGIWQCVPSGNAVCPGTAVENPEMEIPGTTEGFGDLRFEPGSLELPAGTSSLTFTITRQVMSGSEGSINLFAGAVNGPGSIAKNAAAKESLSILEDPASMAFVQQPTDAVLNEPINPAVTIELLDDSGARLDVDGSTSLDLYLWTSDESSANRIRNGVTPENGLYTFDNIVIETAGEYFLRAEVEGLTDVDSQTFIVD